MKKIATNIIEFINNINESRFLKRNEEQYKECLTSDIMRMEIIEDYLKNIEIDSNYNIKKPDYFKLIDDQNGYDDQTYIQKINENEFIFQEGQVDLCQVGLYSKAEYVGLSKSEAIEKLVKDRFPRIAEEFDYKIKSYGAFKYKGKIIMKVVFIKK